MHYRNAEDLNSEVGAGVAYLPGDVDLVVSVSPGSQLAADMLATYADLPLIDLESFISGAPTETGGDNSSRDARCPLLLQDADSSGRSLRDAYERVSAQHAGQVRTGTIYARPGTERAVDFYVKRLDQPLVFEWDLMDNSVLADCCVDIDGVLCRDPTPEENDESEGYEKFLRTVAPSVVPSVEIGWLVTSRLECYRGETEEWLRANGIRYRELVMLDVPSAAERRRRKLHGPFKAVIYKRTGASLFIESSRTQAVEIARRSGKSTLAYCARELISPPGPGAKFAGWASDHAKAWKRCLPAQLEEPSKRFVQRLRGRQSIASEE